jgi:ATP-dependent NAD(P)H-hydrate dehydratase
MSMLSNRNVELSDSELRIREAARKLVFPMNFDAHKGQSGKVAVVGGCTEYTGAPYFAAMSSLRVGADLSHVFCHSDAASVIKSYSGELIVHPLDLESPESLEHSLSEWLPRMSSVVVGPGLGRSEAMLDVAAAVIRRAVELELPLVVDGDGLWLVAQRPDLIRNHSKVVLTPNVVEFRRIADAVLGDTDNGDRSARRVAEQLGFVTILQKRAVDLVTDGRRVIECTEVGSPRRCGGQGDITAGSIGTFLGWAYRRKGEQEARSEGNAHTSSSSNGGEAFSPTMIAAYAGVRLTKLCNAAAFERKHRSATTTDMLEHIGEQFHKHFDS